MKNSAKQLVLCFGLFLLGVVISRAQKSLPSLEPMTSGTMTGSCFQGQGAVVSNNGIIYACYNGSWQPISSIVGTTGSIGGGLLAIGGTASGTANVPGAIAGQACIASASDGTNMLALGLIVHCDVTSSNTATVTLYAIITLTPAAKTYTVRVP